VSYSSYPHVEDAVHVIKSPAVPNILFPYHNLRGFEDSNEIEGFTIGSAVGICIVVMGFIQ
jgi:hypothetical protein